MRQGVVGDHIGHLRSAIRYRSDMARFTWPRQHKTSRRLGPARRTLIIQVHIPPDHGHAQGVGLTSAFRLANGVPDRLNEKMPCEDEGRLLQDANRRETTSTPASTSSATPFEHARLAAHEATSPASARPSRRWQGKGKGKQIRDWHLNRRTSADLPSLARELNRSCAAGSAIMSPLAVATGQSFRGSASRALAAEQFCRSFHPIFWTRST